MLQVLISELNANEQFMNALVYLQVSGHKNMQVLPQ